MPAAGPFRAVDLIAKKRDGHALSTDEIRWFIQALTAGEIPDYQAAAWLMAVFLKGMDDRETADLTLAMAESGSILSLPGVPRPVVDKHSTGGVGDKITLVVAPMVAATGLPVGKMSGRGLGFSGGTLDKLEAIRGFNVNLTNDQFTRQLRDVRLVVAGQSADHAPADGKLYALRDVTATVESLPLIASSIMSKKIAAGADAIVLDVKVGRGAFMKTEADAVALAEAMVRIGQALNRRVTAVVSDMSQPLGYAVGNALEVQEAVRTLQGQAAPDLLDVALTVGGHMLLVADRVTSLEEGEAQLRESITSGAALARLRAMVVAQGGDPAQIDDPSRLPQAPFVRDVVADQAGFVTAIDALEIALAAVDLGAGRSKKGDAIDPAVGVTLERKVGAATQPGEPLAHVHARTEATAARAVERVKAALTIGPTPVEPPPHIRRVIR